MEKVQLGQAIRVARVAKSMTQAQLASRARVSRAFLAQLESGHRESSKVVKRISEILEIDLQKLCTRINRYGESRLHSYPQLPELEPLQLMALAASSPGVASAVMRSLDQHAALVELCYRDRQETCETHWLLHDGHRRFRGMLAEVVGQAAADLKRTDARETLGYEHDQCQHFFTKLFSLLGHCERELSESLRCCSKIPDVYMEIRYFRSVSRRSKQRQRPQLVESETGADFALTLEVNIPHHIHTNRSVLGQAKLADPTGVPIAEKQLADLLATAGPESALYMMWGDAVEARLVTAVNVQTLARDEDTDLLSGSVLGFGRTFSEFLCELFLGLWFGKEWDRSSFGDDVPDKSPTALYAMLHGGPPPPNVIHVGIGSASSEERFPPGVHIAPLRDLSEEDDERR